MNTWIIENAEDVQVILFFALFALFGLAEFIEPRRKGPMMRKARWLTNLLLTTINVVVLSLLPVTFFSVAVWASIKGIGLFDDFTTPSVLLIVGTLLARGFISFFTHYLMHRVPVFWRLHQVHHLDTELDVSTTVRFHPLEFILNLLIGAPIVVAFGMSPWVLLLYEMLDAGINVFSHANVRLPKWLDRALHYFIVTPDLHRIHHSSWQPETDSNFSAVFPIWDIIFGTFRTTTRAPQETMELGLEKVRDERTNSLIWLLKAPFARKADASENQEKSEYEYENAS